MMKRQERGQRQGQQPEEEMATVRDRLRQQQEQVRQQGPLTARIQPQPYPVTVDAAVPPSFQSEEVS